MSNRTKSSLLNLSVGVISQAANLVVGFISRTLFIHFLSVEYLGITGLLTNVLTVLSFAELGIGEAMVYAMYKPAKENDLPTMRKLMKLYKKMYTIIGIAVGAIGVFMSFFAEYFVESTPNIPEKLQFIFVFYSVNNMLSYFLTYKKSLLIVYQKNYVVTSITQITTLCQHAVQIAIIAITRQYYLYLMIQMVFTVVNNLIISIVVNRKYPWIKEKEDEKLPVDIKKGITKNIKSLSIAKIAGVVSNGADNIIISKLCGLATVGLASNYTLITSSVNGILWSGLTSITSSFGNFNVDSSILRRRELFDDIYLCSYWLYSFFSICIVTLANSFIELWLGIDFVLSEIIVLALVWIVYIGGVNFPVYVYSTTLGMYDKMKYPYLASGILNIVLSILFGLKWDVFGIYLATSISRLFTSEVFGAYYVYKYGLQLSPLKYLLKYCASFALFIANLTITKVLVSQIDVDGVMGFLLKIFVCVVVSNLIMLLVCFKTSAFKRVKTRILTLFKRNSSAV